MFVSRGFRGGNGGGGFGVEYCGCIGLGLFFFPSSFGGFALSHFAGVLGGF